MLEIAIDGRNVHFYRFTNLSVLVLNSLAFSNGIRQWKLSQIKKLER